MNLSSLGIGGKIFPKAFLLSFSWAHFVFRVLAFFLLRWSIDRSANGEGKYPIHDGPFGLEITCEGLQSIHRCPITRVSGILAVMDVMLTTTPCILSSRSSAHSCFIYLLIVISSHTPISLRLYLYSLHPFHSKRKLLWSGWGERTLVDDDCVLPRAAE